MPRHFQHEGEQRNRHPAWGEGNEPFAGFAPLFYSPGIMSQTTLTVPMPANLADLRFPKALDDRLHHLLDEQGRRGKLTAAEKREAEALARMSNVLSILKLGSQVRTAKT